ncbi:hypothetical protein [Methanobrevibacter curvatus]|nr:hypothetical protein [Methanobrevibacter curvatus]
MKNKKDNNADKKIDSKKEYKELYKLTDKKYPLNVPKFNFS